MGQLRSLLAEASMLLYITRSFLNYNKVSIDDGEHVDIGGKAPLILVITKF